MLNSSLAIVASSGMNLASCRILKKPVEKFGAVWVNFFCCILGLSLAVLPLLISGFKFSRISFPGTGLLIVSGVLGIGIAETLILRSIRSLGALNVVLFLGFQPLLVDLGIHYFFHSQIALVAGVLPAAVVVMILLIRLFQREIRFNRAHLLMIFGGVVLDSVALILWKAAFMASSSVSPEEAALIRYGAGIFSITVAGVFFGSRQSSPWGASLISVSSLWVVIASLGVIGGSILFSYGLSQTSPVSAACIALLVPAVLVLGIAARKFLHS